MNLGQQDETEFLGHRGNDQVVEIDGFWFGKNKKAAGVNKQSRVGLVLAERHTGRKIAKEVEGERKNDSKCAVEYYIMKIFKFSVQIGHLHISFRRQKVMEIGAGKSQCLFCEE